MNSFCTHLKNKKQQASSLSISKQKEVSYQLPISHAPTFFLNRQKVIALPITGNRQQHRINNAQKKILQDIQMHCTGMQYVNAVLGIMIPHGKALNNIQELQEVD